MNRPRPQRQTEQPQPYRVNGELSGHPLDKQHPPAGAMSAAQSRAIPHRKVDDDWTPPCACSPDAL